MLHQMNIKVTNNFERNGAPYEQKTSACRKQSSWIPFNTKFVDTHQTDRNIAKRCPLPVLAQRIHTRYELRQNYTPRIARNHTGSIISITGKSSTIVCINGNLPRGGGSHGTFGWGVKHLVWVRTLFKTWTPLLKRGIFQQNLTLFQNQMVKTYIKFQTKTAKNP